MGRAPCCDKANVKKGPWSPEEDAKLKAYIEKYGTGGNWIALPHKIGLKRCGKSCRLRWLNYLRPNIKHGGFSEEEDNIICSLYISIGSRWSIIAAQLPGRTDNDIKNYWNTKLKKKLLGRRKQSNLNRLQDPNNQLPTDNNIDSDQFSQGLSNSALERLQLHMQLQTLHTPFSFYSNPALWPKNNVIQTIQASNGSTPPDHPDLLHLQPQNQHFYDQPSFADGNNNNLLESSAAVGKVDDMVQSNEGGGVVVHQQSVSNFQAELDELLNSKSNGDYAPQEEQMSEFDCFKDMNCSKDSLIWWSTTDFDAKSASSNSWDSTSVLQPNGMFQDYELGYNM